MIFWRCLRGPTLSRIHYSGDGNRRAYNHEPNGIENAAQTVIDFLHTTKLILMYTTPLWSLFLYRRGYCTLEYFYQFAKFACLPAFLLFGAYAVRGYGRLKNQQYLDFLDVLYEVYANPYDPQKRRILRTFDFDFNQWPVDFETDRMIHTRPSQAVSIWKRMLSENKTLPSTLIRSPKELVAYCMSHSFGIRMIYPGSMSVLLAAYGSALTEARSKLVEEEGGIRAKLRTEDGNEIDCMFVDRRQGNDPNRYDPDEGPDVKTQLGNTLVICCEGNAGFYEVGCMCTPMGAGYSVLGWNHPGFAGSTGKPFPEAENFAMDAVVQYAIQKLGFTPENIIVFAWSIGAYSAINAAVAYPDIQGLVLDATFHDIMPFARKTMPTFAENIVEHTIRNYLNLHNSENLKKFKGPVMFIRRTEDEVMNLRGPKFHESNLGNKLLEEFLQHRFPNLFERAARGEEPSAESPQSAALSEWLHAPDDRTREYVLIKFNSVSDECDRLLRFFFASSPSIPYTIGEKLTSIQKTRLVLHLADKQMIHYHSSHCTPLPSRLLATPWSVQSFLQNVVESDSDYEVVQSASSNSSS